MGGTDCGQDRGEVELQAALCRGDIVPGGDDPDLHRPLRRVPLLRLYHDRADSAPGRDTKDSCDGGADAAVDDPLSVGGLATCAKGSAWDMSSWVKARHFSSIPISSWQIWPMISVTAL